MLRKMEYLKKPFWHIYLKRPVMLNLTRSYKASESGYFGCLPQNQNRAMLFENYFDNQITHSSVLKNIVKAYRDQGFLKSMIDPLNLRKTFDLKKSFGLYNLDLNDIHSMEGILNLENVQEASLGTIIEHLEERYCNHIGFEVAHLLDSEEKEWFYEIAENPLYYTVSNENKKLIASHLLKAQILENFLAKKFPTLKRYSGEGAESMLSFFHGLFSVCVEKDVEEVLISIPHRGRISLLTCMLNYPSSSLFHKIKGNPEFNEKYNFIGDVISHLTSSTELHFNEKSLHVTMVPNPSHLEASHPVVFGKTRGRQLSKNYGFYGNMNNINKIMNIQIHGDAAIAAQGIVMESVSLASLPHFDVGGTVHLIVNNQVGFTTPYGRASSSNHCSDICKVIDCPILHVNGDYPEEVAKAARIAFEYKNKFGKDIFVNMHCYRKWGHNELDNPKFTNPGMYRVIDEKRTVPDCYKVELLEKNVLNLDEVLKLEKDYYDMLEEEFKQAGTLSHPWQPFEGYWKGITQASCDSVSLWDTGVCTDTLKLIGKKSVQTPDNFNVHSHLVKTHCEQRLSKLDTGSKIDWATAEALAIGSLLLNHIQVRISGQDVGRATFNHRHAMFIDQETDEIYIPLNDIISDQKGFLEVANSPLSEEAVLAYEYGMSIENPNHLVIWEAQFGDFFNGAQIIIDTFISSGEIKWLLQSGLVMLLPHGMDGAGPDHSSCKMERFLQLSDSKEDGVDGDDVNMEIVNPTTPAQYFHLLRRQMVRNYRKPLIVVAPKLLLRMPSATSTLSEMSQGTCYRPVIGDDKCKLEDIKTVAFCSGKYYYEIEKLREKYVRNDMAIIRLESLVPFPTEELKTEISRYSAAKEFFWCQEEHRNQGAWGFVYPRFYNLLNLTLSYIGRPVLGASAVGITKWHSIESEKLVNELFGEH